MLQNEERLLDACIDRLREALGAEVTILALEAQGHNARVVALIVFEVEGRKYEFALEAKERLSRYAQSLPLPDEHVQPVLCAPHVNKNLGAVLRQRGIQFLDGAGNMHLRRPGLFLNATGFTPKAAPMEALLTGLNLHAAGLRLVWALLSDPLAVRLSNRELARRAGVAYGGITNQLRGLRNSGFIIKDGGVLRMDNVAALAARWVDGYVERLRPKLVVREYHCAGPVAELAERILGMPRPFRPVIGGELGAAMKHPGLVSPATATLHVPAWQAPHIREMSRSLQLMATKKGGNVHLLEMLGDQSGREEGEGRPWADPLLLLGELALLPTDRLGALRRNLIHDLELLHTGTGA